MMAAADEVTPKSPPTLIAPLLIALLEDSATISAEELSRARAAATQADKRVDEALVELGLMTEARLRNLLSERLGIFDLADNEILDAPVCHDQLA